MSEWYSQKSKSHPFTKPQWRITIGQKKLNGLRKYRKQKAQSQTLLPKYLIMIIVMEKLVNCLMLLTTIKELDRELFLKLWQEISLRPWLMGGTFPVQIRQNYSVQSA